jgi:hypothetical protein
VAESNAKKVTPPYATPAGLQLFFEKIKTLKPTTLNKKWAEDNELPFAEAIVNSMKFLKAVNGDGSLTPDFARLRLEGAAFEETLAKLVTTAYGPIFDQLDDIKTVSGSSLNNAFKSAYDVGSPGRYVRPFLTLCELAGLRSPASTTDSPAPRAAKASSGPMQSKSKRAAVRGDPARLKGRKKGLSSAPSIQIVLRLDIPWDATTEEIRARVQALESLDIGDME